MLVPSMPLAAARTSSRLRQNLTPPALPRPPAWIWALTIHCEPPRCLAASTAASGELATLPGGTAMPYLANSSLAWYSWKFIRYLERTGETCESVQAAKPARGGGMKRLRRFHAIRPRIFPEGATDGKGRGRIRARMVGRTCRPSGLPGPPRPLYWRSLMAPGGHWRRSIQVSTPASTIAARSSANQSTARHELFFFNYFRLGQAAVYTALAFRPEHMNWPALPDPVLARLFAMAYLLAALVMVARTRHTLHRPVLIVSIGLTLDIAAALMALVLMHDVRMGVAMMLAVNIATGALLLPFRLSMFFAALATLAMLGHSMFDFGTQDGTDREMVEYALFGAAYFACASVCYVLGRNIRASEALAEQRGIDLANLSQVNELIIRRMKTGVLLVDEGNRIHQLNESAWMLMGNPSADQRDLGSLAPELSRRLYHWRTSGKLDESATMLADGTPEVIPRFSRLAPNDDSHVLIFLDDTSLVSRRAEELTLSSLGRLSASIAHEIRNPLAAIHYSAQLLAESTDINDTDLRMVEIINNHCVRLNEIIENILQLLRRERSRPETLDLSQWVHHFVTEYRQGNDLGSDVLRAGPGGEPVAAVADPQHLQQVIWNLVQNALRYGRLPGEPARVMLVARHSEVGIPILEVIDRGPGIPPKVAAQIFEPFFTTHEYGTGLGLYLARQMTEANQAALEYVRVAGGGSCFRISLTPPARTSATAPVAARA